MQYLTVTVYTIDNISDIIIGDYFEAVIIHKSHNITVFLCPYLTEDETGTDTRRDARRCCHCCLVLSLVIGSV